MGVEIREQYREIALSISLQEKKYHALVERINTMLT
jgi:hypothetical protein